MMGESGGVELAQMIFRGWISFGDGPCDIVRNVKREKERSGQIIGNCCTHPAVPSTLRLFSGSWLIANPFYLLFKATSFQSINAGMNDKAYGIMDCVESVCHTP